MFKNDELVSIIIPTYRRSQYIERSIESVLGQTYKNIEIIVVDDNGKDTDEGRATSVVIKKYKNDRRIVYIQHDKNQKGCAARNSGLRAANGKYVCFLDDDDIIYPEKIQKQVEFLEKHPEYQAVYCARKVGKYIHSPSMTGDLTYYLLSGESLVITIMILFRSESIKNLKWNEKLRRNQEAGFMIDFFSHNNRIGKMADVLCESDLSDRANVLPPDENEKEMMKYVDSYILKFKDNNSKIEKKIYAKRYVGLLMGYLKNKQLSSSVIIFQKAFLKTGPIYIMELTKFILKKIFRVKKDYYAAK